MESGDLEPRVEALENQVRDLTAKVQVTQQDAAAARVLAGAADRDVSEIRGELRDFRNATTASFNALRQDFVDLRQDFADLREHVDRRFEQVDQGFMEMRGRFDAAAAGQQRIVDMLTTIMRER
ncbi:MULTISPECIES: hypothetical protein [Mycobacteriaceae]|uniref:Uncharacterized protein n=1 Tax=Mycolicibacterium parafortuitum TaxID=39692 RepID=A0ACC6MJK8_MYCPF|nr:MULTISPECIES: hypothetical protein [Mycobacteriaceae]MDZ5087087.1 hypothetical protein [Mycolicibacterium parafortuitum]GFM19173.1 hypothetical protein PO1_contig-045-30 [Mycobacterium sp. PO1]GFM24643.1 hypothetical protein PO2_contig-045-33 [Mycobacterium sp. PO2]